jgi:hypothetical protein
MTLHTLNMQMANSAGREGEGSRSGLGIALPRVEPSADGSRCKFAKRNLAT